MSNRLGNESREEELLPRRTATVKTVVVSVLDRAAFDMIAALLRQHQIIVAPTDTVYGVMCRFDSPLAIGRLYEAKLRPPEKAIPVLVSRVDQLGRIVELPLLAPAQALIEQFWPGPLTLVMPARSDLPPILTAGQRSVAVRMPDHAGLRQIMDEVGPLAATSANLSGEPECYDAEAVEAQFDGRVPLILIDPPHQNGAVHATTASTIVDLSDLAVNGPRILRPGPIAEEVRSVLARMFDWTC